MDSREPEWGKMMEMKEYRKVPRRLPDHPAVIREAFSNYAIWTGSNWHGYIYRIHRSWTVSTPLCSDKTFEKKSEAVHEALIRALHREGEWGKAEELGNQ